MTFLTESFRRYPTLKMSPPAVQDGRFIANIFSMSLEAHGFISASIREMKFIDFIILARCVMSSFIGVYCRAEMLCHHFHIFILTTQQISAISPCKKYFPTNLDCDSKIKRYNPSIRRSIPVFPTLLAPSTTIFTVLLGTQSSSGYSGMGTSKKLPDPLLFMVPGAGSPVSRI